MNQNLLTKTKKGTQDANNIKEEIEKTSKKITKKKKKIHCLMRRENKIHKKVRIKLNSNPKLTLQLPHFFFLKNQINFFLKKNKNIQ